jgi:hypothetical protein
LRDNEGQCHFADRRLSFAGTLEVADGALLLTSRAFEFYRWRPRMSRLLAYNSARARPPGSRAAHRRGQFLPGPESPRHARVRNHSGHLAEKRSGDPVRVWGPGSSTVETAYSVAMWLYEHASNDFSPQMRRRMIPRFLHASGNRGYVLLVLSALATSPLRLFSIVGEESPS